MGSKMELFGLALNVDQFAIYLKASFTYVVVPKTSIYLHQTMLRVRGINTTLCLNISLNRSMGTVKNVLGLVLNLVQRILTILKSILINDKMIERLLLLHLE